MLFIGEKVGMVHAKEIHGPRPVRFSEVDIAVDPLEGTNLCATGSPNAIAVLAASNRGGLLHAPDLYMEKLVVGPSSREHVSLDAPVHENLKAIASCLGRAVEDLVVVVLDRPRRIDVVYGEEGPFRHLENHWIFHPTETGCVVEFYLDFEFRSRILQRLIGVLFHEAVRRMVGAFEARAKRLYGPPAGRESLAT